MGHSDGDTVCHAVADALLGASALGDVGEHFPESDAAIEGISGSTLLRRVVELLGGAGFTPSSCDVTVVADRPAIAPRRQEIRSRLAEVLRSRSTGLREGHASRGLGARGRRDRMPRSRGGDVSAGTAVVRSSDELITGRRAVAEAIGAGRAVEVLVAPGAGRNQGLRAVLDAAERARVPVREVGRADLDQLARDHRGVIARIHPAGSNTSFLSERDLGETEWAEDAIAVVLDGIEDPQNLGASARSAEAAGASVLVSRTHRGAPVTDAAIRASAGALLHLRHARVANIARAIERLQAAGFSAVGLDGSAERSIFDTRCPDGRIAIVLGSEGSGLSRLVRERCDLLVALPMRGRVDSLNAAASLAAALYAFVLPRGRGGNG